MLALTTALLLAAMSTEGEGALLSLPPQSSPPQSSAPRPADGEGRSSPDPESSSPPQAPLQAPLQAPPQTPSPVKDGVPSTPQHDIVVVGRKPLAGDPLRGANAVAFGVTDKADKAIVGPAARAYKKNVPSPIRRGIHNFLYNLREPIVFVNFLLQFKPGKAAETAGRFVINSTVGVAGVLDMAKRKPFRLPRRSNGFANTLGYHGVKNGPFLFLPLVGPTTVRDLFGGALDRLLMPVAIGKPFTSPTYTIPAGVLGALDHRAEFDETLKDLHDGAADPYAASREFYLRRRQAEIDHLHGRNVDAILGPGGVTAPPPREAMPIIEKAVSEAEQPAPLDVRVQEQPPVPTMTTPAPTPQTVPQP